MHRHAIIVGAQRAGTTYLYRALEEHPQACMARPMRPEPKYFLDPERWRLGYDAYLAAHFRHRKPGQVLAEKGTSYIERFDAIPRIKSVLPEVRLVFALRDPSARAYSNWKFSSDNGLEELPFLDAIAAEQARVDAWSSGDQSVCPHSYLGRGMYADYLERWSRHFPRANILVLVSEQLFNGDAWAKLQSFLGLDILSPPDFGRINASQGTSPPDAVLDQVAPGFRDANRRLALEWDLDISSWRGNER